MDISEKFLLGVLIGGVGLMITFMTVGFILAQIDSPSFKRFRQ